MVGNSYKGFIGVVDDKQQLQKVCRCYRWQVEATKGLQVLQIVGKIYRRSINSRNQLHETFWLFFQLYKDDNCCTMVSVAKWQANKKTFIIFMCFHVVSYFFLYLATFSLIVLRCTNMRFHNLYLSRAPNAQEEVL